jgi:hypothetical protein
MAVGVASGTESLVPRAPHIFSFTSHEVGWSRSHLSTGKMSKGVHKYCLSVGEGEVTNSETENHSAWEIVMPTDRIR